MADKYSGLAQGILQAGQSIGAGFQNRGSNELKAKKLQYEQMKAQRTELRKNKYQTNGMWMKAAGTTKDPVEQTRLLNLSLKGQNDLMNSVLKEQGKDPIPWVPVERISAELSAEIETLKTITDPNNKDYTDEFKRNYEANFNMDMARRGLMSGQKAESMIKATAAIADEQRTRTKFQDEYPKNAESIVNQNRRLAEEKAKQAAVKTSKDISGELRLNLGEQDALLNSIEKMDDKSVQGWLIKKVFGESETLQGKRAILNQLKEEAKGLKGKGVPQKEIIEDGYRYIGGPKNKASSWEKIK